MNEWIFHVKGGPETRPTETGTSIEIRFEICAMKNDFEHGKKSFGWYHPDQKILIATDSDLRFEDDPEQKFHEWVKKARAVVYGLNKSKRSENNENL